jgi:hypothetical protein
LLKCTVRGPYGFGRFSTGGHSVAPGPRMGWLHAGYGPSRLLNAATQSCMNSLPTNTRLPPPVIDIDSGGPGTRAGKVPGEARHGHHLIKGPHRAVAVACQVEAPKRPAEEVDKWKLRRHVLLGLRVGWTTLIIRLRWPARQGAMQALF